MIDTVAQYAIQFAAIVAGAMALSEWATIPVGVVGKSRKRFNALIYSFALGELGWFAGLVQMPSEV